MTDMDDFDDFGCDDERYEDDLSDWEETQVFADGLAEMADLEEDYESPLMGPDEE